jgi:ketosteroid isomerase-like protein
MKLTSLATVLVLVTAGGFAWKAQSQSQASGTETLLKLEADFEKTTAEHGFEGFISYFADDSADLPNGGLIVSGKENIRRTEGPWPPDLSLTWTPVHADMAASGDLGYTFGTFVLKAKDKDGNPIMRYGKYATVWKRQKDGNWKVAMDMGNSSPNPKP